MNIQEIQEGLLSEKVTVNSRNTLNMRSGNSITLQPGFSVELGAEFSATIENIHDCGASSAPAPKIMVQNVPEEYDDMTDIQIENKSNFSYTVYPNPSDEFINITYSLDMEMSLSIEFGKSFRTKNKDGTT